MKGVCTVVVVCACLLCIAAQTTSAYGFYKYGNGRQDYSNRYDLAGVMFPGHASASLYDFGQVGGFQDTAPEFLRNNASAAIGGAFQDWGQYGRVAIQPTMGAYNSGLVRLRYNASVTGAGTYGYGAEGNYAVVEFGPTASGGAAWTAASFNWVMKHEVGHVLGIRDLYDEGWHAPLPEDNVDHVTRSRTGEGDTNDLPNRDPESLVDNIMYQYRYDGNDYSKTPQTIIDNDEIAAVTWLWGGNQHQVVTGDLGGWAGDFSNVRGADYDHGDQPGNPLTWWDYRGTVSWGGSANKPRVSLEFVGYETFIMNSYPSTTWIHIDGGGDIQVFESEDPNWTGNFDLWVKSKYSKDRRIWASVFGGGRTDVFSLNPVTRGLGHEVGPLSDAWVMPFGPMIPEPASLLTLVAGLGLLVRRRRR